MHQVRIEARLEIVLDLVGAMLAAGANTGGEGAGNEDDGWHGAVDAEETLSVQDVQVHNATAAVRSRSMT
jgi:hypothetical protein